MIQTVQSADLAAITDIYNHYIEHSVATFEEVPLQEADIAERVKAVTDLGLPWLVAKDDSGKVTGYAYANQFKNRSAYRFSAEVTVYLAPDLDGKGWGTKLYQALFDALKATEIQTAIGLVTVPNDASAALHEKFGMEKVGQLSRVGYKFGRWLDVGFWQGPVRR